MVAIFVNTLLLIPFLFYLFKKDINYSRIKAVYKKLQTYKSINMKHYLRHTLRISRFSSCLRLTSLLFIICFVGCGTHMSNSDVEAVRAYEDSLYLECLKDSAVFEDFEYYPAFNDDSFTDFIKTNVSSLTYPFEKLQEVGCVYTNTSKDGNFRIYEWNDHGVTTKWGGINYLCQYRTKAGEVKTVDNLFDLLEPTEDNGGFFLEGLNRISEVCSIVNKDGNAIYVWDFYGRADTQYGNHLIAAFYIDGESLKEYKAFENDMSYLYVEYGGIADWYFRTGGLGWEWVNSYDHERKAIYVPHFTYSDIMFDRYDVYQFDGRIFKNIRTDGGFWLNPELRDFTELKTVFKTKDYLIRVDAVGDGFYRYTSWKKDKTMLDTPELETYSDIYDKEKHYFVFDEGEYKYIVDDGVENDSYDKGIIVEHNGKVVMRQNREL